MSLTLRLLAVLGLTVFIAGCSQQEEPVFVEEPVVMEPTSNKM